MHSPTADHVLQQHARFEAALDLAASRAGDGPDAVFERRLMGCMRELQALFEDQAAVQAVAEAAEAACRAMDAAEPEAPLGMLVLARERLARFARRRALDLPRHRQAA